VKSSFGITCHTEPKKKKKQNFVNFRRENTGREQKVELKHNKHDLPSSSKTSSCGILHHSYPHFWNYLPCRKEAILRNVRREIEKTHVETQF
jgi:hypothetical protein